MIPSSIRKSNERANGALLFRSFNLFAQVVNGFKHWNFVHAFQIWLICSVSAVSGSKPVVDIWRLFGVFGREVACLWMEALSYCFYSSPTDTGWTFGFSQTWSLRMPRWSGLSGNAVYDFSLNNKVLDNRAIWGKKCSLSLRGCLYLCWKLLKKILFF